MLSNVQRPLFKKSLPEPPNKKSSAAVASAEKDEQYFASLFEAVESPAKSPISSNIDVAEQVYFSPGTLHKSNPSYSHVEYSGLSEKSTQHFVSNNTPPVENSDSALCSDRQLAQKTSMSELPISEKMDNSPFILPPLDCPSWSKESSKQDPVLPRNNNPTSQQPTSVSGSSEDQRSQVITSAHSKAQSIPNESYKQEVHISENSQPTEDFSVSYHSRKKNTYSIDSNETESLSSIDHRSGSSRSPSREKLPVARPNSISIPRSTVQPIYYSTNWKSETCLSLGKVKNASHIDFNVFKPIGGRNPFKRISRVLNAIPSGNNGGSAKARGVVNSLGQTSAARVEAYKRQISELQHQRTDIHCWVNIMKNRGSRSIESTNVKLHHSVSNIPVAQNPVRNVEKKIDLAQRTRSRVANATTEPHISEAPIVNKIHKSHKNVPSQHSAPMEYKLDIPIETSDGLFDWDHFDKELSKINSDHRTSLEFAGSKPKTREQPEPSRSTKFKDRHDEVLPKEPSKSITKRPSSQIISSRRAFVVENDRSRPHSYHPNMHTDEGFKSNIKFSSSSVADSFDRSPTQFPPKSKHPREQFKRLTNKLFSKSAFSKPGSSSDYIKGDSDDETPLSVVASRNTHNPPQRAQTTPGNMSGDLRNIRDKSRSGNLSSPELLPEHVRTASNTSLDQKIRS